MKTLRRPTKSDILINMFGKIGSTAPVEAVCQKTGIKNYNSLKAFFSYIRNSKHVADGSRIDVRIKDGVCIRVG